MNKETQPVEVSPDFDDKIPLAQRRREQLEYVASLPDEPLGSRLAGVGADAARGLGGLLWGILGVLTIPFWAPVVWWRNDSTEDERSRLKITFTICAVIAGYYLFKAIF